MNLSQAQQNILSKDDLKPYLSFSLSTPLSAVLQPNVDQYDIATLLHCMFYFPSPAVLLQTFKDLHDHNPPIKTLALAEYALQASATDQNPHVLAVLAQSALESLRIGNTLANVRTVLSPKKITEIALEAGWKIRSEEKITPELGLQDGRWEIGTVVSKSWEKEVEDVFDGMKKETGNGDEGVIQERQKSWVMATRDATVAAVENLDGEDMKSKRANCRTMDTWCALFDRV